MKSIRKTDPYKVIIESGEGETAKRWVFRVSDIKEDDLREKKEITLIDAEPVQEQA